MLRALVSLGATVIVTLVLLPFQWLAVRKGWPLRWRIPTLFSGIVCRLLGVHVTMTGCPADTRPLLIVANHISWLDIVVISAVTPVVFVAKREVAGWPVVGLLARLQRTVFVDRTRPHRTHHVNGEIARRLTEGDPVVLFGEGTSSDGNRVLTFRSALIGSARAALADARNIKFVWVQPLSIAYTRMLGVPLGRRSRSDVAWYGEAPLWPHLWRVLTRGAIDVVVNWGEPIAYDASSDRKIVARRLETEVRTMTVAALRGRAAPSRPRRNSFLTQNPI
jgi:lyso-ornithine lipid O-acyltransferase